jgi:hypothetical protein
MIAGLAASCDGGPCWVKTCYTRGEERKAKQGRAVAVISAQA